MNKSMIRPVSNVKDSRAIFLPTKDRIMKTFAFSTVLIFAASFIAAEVTSQPHTLNAQTPPVDRLALKDELAPEMQVVAAQVETLERMSEQLSRIEAVTTDTNVVVKDSNDVIKNQLLDRLTTIQANTNEIKVAQSSVITNSGKSILATGETVIAVDGDPCGPSTMGVDPCAPVAVAQEKTAVIVEEPQAVTTQPVATPAPVVVQATPTTTTYTREGPFVRRSVTTTGSNASMNYNGPTTQFQTTSNQPLPMTSTSYYTTDQYGTRQQTCTGPNCQQTNVYNPQTVTSPTNDGRGLSTQPARRGLFGRLFRR